MEFKICQYPQCGKVFYRTENHDNHNWAQKMYCGHNCKTSAARHRPPELRKQRLPDDPEEVERRKAEVRERHLRELVAAGGRFEAWLD